MKVLPVLLLSIALLGGGLSIMVTSKLDKKVPTPQSTTQEIKNRLINIKSAHLKNVDCKIVQNGVQIEGSVCYLSPLTPEQLLELVKRAIEPLASTPGRTNDYMVWHAFYAVKATPKITFGVNVGDPHNSATFQGSSEFDSAKSFVSFGVD